MVGSIGERMLSITLPHVQSWNAWFTWFGNSPEGYRPIRDQVDAACRSVGRDPATLERTVAVLVKFPGAPGGQQGYSNRLTAEAISGEPAVLAAALRAFAAEGISHIQLVLDPITADSVAALAPTLALLNGSSGVVQ
jgi:alkanesulfonate monooxygenase SsuD/methylene tetrahydromethanopterin reductase-like flavin-dependent oxidoreductase (luciferase family)